MTYDDLQCFRTALNEGVLNVAINSPPMNLLGLQLLLDLDQLGQRVESDDNVKVIVFSSDDPDFFVAHGDVESMVGLEGAPPARGDALGFVHSVLARFSSMQKVSIAQIAGAARGGGSELAMAMDMRFGALEKAVFGQPEAAMGIIPGAGGTQRLPALIGAPRALEMILGCDDIDAVQAERYGYLNRAMPEKELANFVTHLAQRIAALPWETIAAAKQAVVGSKPADSVQGMIEEEYRCNQLLYGQEAQSRMQAFLALGGQQREAERNFGALVDRLIESPPQT
ncbi:MAG: enoyl-CoA hydratase/isomerase family protein [Halioglobus sp.]